MAIGIEKMVGLNPAFKKKADKVVKEMEKRSWRIRIVWGKRSHKENEELVKKGMASRTSKHLVGKGLDLIDRTVGYTENKSHKFYKDLAELAKQEGLIWGGDFKQRWDPCHIEMP